MYYIIVKYFSTAPSDWKSLSYEEYVYGVECAIEYAEAIASKCINVDSIIVQNYLTGEVVWER